MSSEHVPTRKLSFEFSRDIYKDGVKRCLLPSKVLLQSTCCWPDNEGLFYRLCGWLIFVNLFLMDIFHGLYLFKNFRDISEALLTGSTVTADVEALVRLYTMITKRRTINSILVKIWRQFWSIDVLEAKDRQRIRRKVRISIVVTSIFLICGMVSNMTITYDPYLHDHTLVLKSVFPFNWEKPFVYEITYIWQYFACWTALFVISGFDFFFVALVAICSAQYVILQDVTRRILTETSKFQRAALYGRESITMTDREMLMKCLEQHKLLNRICNELEESFNIPILIQFVTSTSAICTASVVLKVDSSQFFKMAMFAAAHLTQLFYYCFVGDELSYQSEELSNAIYECNWHLSCDRNFRKALVLMIQRSQQVQRLTAAGVMNLDYSSFVKILRISFSFFTLLNKLIDKNIGED